MEITIRQPLSFSCLGRKENQEDSLYPATATASSRTFLVCDGMGGHEHGEVASATVASALGGYIDSHLPHADKPFTQADFEQALAAAYAVLDQYDDGSEGRSRMGTTMTCLVLHSGGYLAAHMGDSRIYHIRPSLWAQGLGGLLYQSSDHSLVNSLLAAGELTPEEAKNFPRRNVITRVMQPGLAQRSKAEIHNFADVQAGDYFFMCCDGVLERLTNDRLCEILSTPGFTDEQRMAQIQGECDGMTRDNYTAWLIGVDQVTGTGSTSATVLQAQATQSDEPMPEPAMRQEPKRKSNKLALIAIATIVIAAAVAYVATRKAHAPVKPKIERVQQPHPKS